MKMEVWKESEDLTDFIVHTNNQVAVVVLRANGGKIKATYSKNGEECEWDVRVKEEQLKISIQDLKEMKKQGIFNEIY